MKTHTESKAEFIVSSMLQIYNFFKSRRKERDAGGEWMMFLYSKNYPLDEDQKQARELMDKVRETIKAYNSQISDQAVYESLLFELTQKAIWYPKDYPDIESEYQKVTNSLLFYNAQREIDIPIVNLEVGESPRKFGLVTFFNIEESDKNGEWWDVIKATAGGHASNVYSFARISCPGDTEKSLEYAFKVISKTLTILRAIGFPIELDPNLQFGLINEYSLFQVRPYRLGLPDETFKLNYRPKIIRRIGPGVAPCHLQTDILSSIESTNISALQSIMESDLITPSSETKRKYFFGLHWLGESTKPDSPEARFAKLAFALEAFIGGDAEDKKGILSTRGLTATLAERAAFLAERDPTERNDLHKQVYNFYRIRSGIVHGGNKKTGSDDFVAFTSLVRKISWALLRHIDEFQNIDDLQNWVLEQRYS